MLSYRSTLEFVRTLEKCGEALCCTSCFSMYFSRVLTNSCVLLHLNIARWQVLYFFIIATVPITIQMGQFITITSWLKNSRKKNFLIHQYEITLKHAIQTRFIIYTFLFIPKWKVVFWKKALNYYWTSWNCLLSCLSTNTHCHLLRKLYATKHESSFLHTLKQFFKHLWTRVS